MNGVSHDNCFCLFRTCILVNVIYLILCTILIYFVYDLKTHGTINAPRFMEALKQSHAWTRRPRITMVTTKSPATAVPQIIMGRDSNWHKSYLIQRGDFWVFYNAVKAQRKFQGNESITLTTPSDPNFLDNLIPLAGKWKGPISCAVYTPGHDFSKALRKIFHLRECGPPSLKDFVTFHLFFDREHLPSLPLDVWAIENTSKINCQDRQKRLDLKNRWTYRKEKGLNFPINVARNIARESATTHFVFPSDIELYPSDNVIPDFLEMMAKYPPRRWSRKPKVFVLPVFEIPGNVTTYPRDKKELKVMLDQSLAFSFHAKLCAVCHKIPKYNAWVNNTKETEMKPFTRAKREGPLRYWEPFYIGTKTDPSFDERVTWEGKRNKRIQAYTLCVLDYDFYVLNNAFLVHRAGVKTRWSHAKKDMKHQMKEMETFIHSTILPEIHILYGKKSSCIV